MKKLVVTLLAFAFTSIAAYAQPKIQIAGGMTHDWGNVSPQQTALTTKMKIKNVGNEDLKIEKVQPACGCTTAPLDKDVLKPGEETTMNITLNINARTGLVTKTINVSTNDPANKNFNISLKANVINPLAISPAYFSFPEMVVGKSGVTTVKITNSSKEPITFSNITLPAGMKLNVGNSFTIKPGESKELDATYTPQKPGAVSVEVKMNTTSDEYKELIIKCYGMVK